ncbi:MAG TPA: PHB depolymerase family esterase [Polyangiaceae bacterium]|jgi:poly(3-hydroxybutyrate) depolymerase|nr:PHB depolymerase family esterase [Polyangiaceae bacterium]
MVKILGLLCIGALSACSSGNGDANGAPPAGSGGSSAGTGGVASSSGGNAAAAGGASTTGTGGTASGGTAVGSGGSTSAGNGGSSGGNTSANGGASTGGASAGTGGASTSSGGATTSSGGASSGGQGGGSSGDVSKSAGCGMAAPMAGDLMIDVMGMSREYIIELPANYDPSKAYKLVFAWHGLGGTAKQVASNWYGLKSLAANSTIFVAGQGLQTSNSVGSGPGWPNTNGEDVAFVKTLYAKLQGQVCFDQSRVFSVGMSYGGIMSDTLGCQMGDVFRAIAPMSGAGPYGKANCVGQVAVWLSNGDSDTTVPTAQEEASRDFWVAANHCQMQSMPVDPSPCVSYQGCDAGNPVTWCEFMGGHTIPPFAAGAIWKFFAQF